MCVMNQAVHLFIYLYLFVFTGVEKATMSIKDAGGKEVAKTVMPETNGVFNFSVENNRERVQN